MSHEIKPFDCQYSPQFAELLTNLNISLVISTYQAGKLITLSPQDTDKLVQLPRTFDNVMGLAVKDDTLAAATKYNVEILKNDTRLAPLYPNKPNTYDHIYIPQATYHTGPLALHDMAFLNDKLVAVNTMFSTLAYIDDTQSFTPFWQPPFITELEPEDRCHLNGLAIENNEIKYLTALGNSNEKNGWRENKINGGILMEYPSGKIILDGLSMPHSPRIYNGKLYVLNSAQGELIEVDVKNHSYEVLLKLDGFLRGMDRFGDYLFIAGSKLRHNNETFKNLPISETSFSGIIAIYLPTKTVIGKFEYKMSVDEIYDVKVLPDTLRPNILTTEGIGKTAISFSDNYFWAKLKENDEQQPQGSAKQQDQTSTKKPEDSFAIQLFKNISQEKLVTDFEPLLFPDAIDNLKTGSFFRLNALIYLIENNPVGALVFEVKEDRTATIHSLFILPKFRQFGLATQLVKQLEPLLASNNITYTEVVYDEHLPQKTAIEKLMRKISSVNLLTKD
jgi:uncharacterized protein (TIGR03032 family)